MGITLKFEIKSKVEVTLMNSNLNQNTIWRHHYMLESVWATVSGIFDLFYHRLQLYTPLIMSAESKKSCIDPFVWNWYLATFNHTLEKT